MADPCPKYLSREKKLKITPTDVRKPMTKFMAKGIFSTFVFVATNDVIVLVVTKTDDSRDIEVFFRIRNDLAFKKILGNIGSLMKSNFAAGSL